MGRTHRGVKEPPQQVFQVVNVEQEMAKTLQEDGKAINFGLLSHTREYYIQCRVFSEHTCKKAALYTQLHRSWPKSYIAS